MKATRRGFLGAAVALLGAGAARAVAPPLSTIETKVHRHIVVDGVCEFCGPVLMARETWTQQVGDRKLHTIYVERCLTCEAAIVLSARARMRRIREIIWKPSAIVPAPTNHRRAAKAAKKLARRGEKLKRKLT